MPPIFRVVVNWTTAHRVASIQEVNTLCNQLAERSVFCAHVHGDQTHDPSLDIIVVSGRAHVFYLDIARGVKLASRHQTCTIRGIVSLYNEAYPELGLDQVEVQCRSLISPDRALLILRHYLKTGEAIDLVPWPSPDALEWSSHPTLDRGPPLDELETTFPGEEIPF